MPAAANHMPVRLAVGRDRPLSWPPAVYRRATIVASRSITVKTELPAVKKIHYFTDGCAGQYKNKNNFINLCQCVIMRMILD